MTIPKKKSEGAGVDPRLAEGIDLEVWIPEDAPDEPVDAEHAAFCDDLLESIKQMHRGEYARIHHVPITAATQARNALGVSQSEFARLLGISVRTLQNWEQGITKPSGAARTLLKIAASHPNVLRSV